MARERWGYLIAGQLQEAYAYLSPGVREVMSFDSYRGRTRVGTWRSATVQSVSCSSAEVCSVAVAVGYVVPVRGAGTFENVSLVREQWRYQGGRWWFVPEQL